jgi:hypothetical protein
LKTTHRFALAALLTIAGLSSAQAGEWGPDCRKGDWGSEWYFDHVDKFCQENGVKFSHGFFYPGLAQKHFSEKWYDWRFKTWLYWDPHAHSPYYWCEGHGVWYPVRYISEVAPGAKGPGPVAVKPGAGPAPGGAGPAPGGPGVAPGVAPAPGNAPATPGGAGAVEKAAAPATPAPPLPSGNTGAGSPPPEPTSTDAGRVARVQGADRPVPTGTFDDPIAQ